MNVREALRALWARRPTKLRELEAVVGRLARDVTDSEAYRVERHGLCGFHRFSVAFVGHRLRDDPDPAIIEISLEVPHATLDLRALATEVLGAGLYRSKSWPEHEFGGEYTREWLEWADDVGHWDQSDRDTIAWTRHEPHATAQERSCDEATDLVARIVALVAHPLRSTTLEEVFDPLDIDGRGPYHVAGGRTWTLRARYVDALEAIHLHFEPVLPIAELATALGWRDVYLRKFDTHDLSWTVHDAATNARVGGGGVEIVLHVADEHELASRDDIEPYVAHAIEGAVIEGITIQPRATSPARDTA